jgi:hypothetical protein
LLQRYKTNVDPDDYRIPAANDDNDFVRIPSSLRGWIEQSYDDLGRDEVDPWAADLGHAPKPAEFVRKKLGLKHLSEDQTWRSSDEICCKSQSWALEEKNDYDRGEKSFKGTRLTANAAFLEALMAEFGKFLIVKVHARQSQTSESDQRTELFLIRPGLQISRASGISIDPET